MLEWYNILFFTCLAIFLIKMVITLFLGDADVDFDVDGDVDFDVSSMVSFKGVLHFLLGFSSYLAAVAHFDTSFALFGPYKFSIGDYIMAIGCGFLFMLALFYLYKLMMKLNHYNTDEIDLNGYTCTILGMNFINPDDNECSYYVLVNTPVGSRKINVLAYDNDLIIGSEHQIYRNEQGIYCI